MTRTTRPPVLALVLLLIASLTAVGTAAPARGKKAAAAKSSKADRKGRADKGRDRKSSAREERASKRDRRSAREERAERRKGKRGREVLVERRGRPLSKRERLAAARREAEERRRRAEAARRAELARLAAIARQRALDESLRQQVQQNILRDDTTGEDPEVRRVAVSALGYHAGSVVVMNPKTGRIYTIVNQDWGVRRGFKPCSTTKLVTGLAGLSEGVIDPVQENVNFTSGRLNLTDALAFSNNPYFQRVGQRVGFERMSSYARQLGLGERTGVNHVNEYPGRLPLFKDDRGMLRMSSHGDDIEVTPLQLATLASVFANGGALVTPHLPRTPEENVNFKTELRRQLSIPQETLRRMLPGMIGAVNYGSGRKAYDPSQTIAGKTGTCIGAGGVWDGSFTSYGPVEDPQLAIAVIGRGSDARNHFPAAVAGQIYRTLSYRFGKRNGKPVYQLTPDMLAPRPKVDPATVADTDEEEAEEARSADALNAADPAATDTNATETVNSGGSGVKRVLMTVPQVQPQRPAGAAPQTAKPAPSPTATSQQPQQKQPGDTRPRRVGDNHLQ